ncbi:MAG: hypothetical protein P1U85_11965 [Verrucomicrobiales bacterium]|jgi:nitrate reductase NapE component|nr:hypothetical protein [Verrucomicrobiales bacterium]
MKEKDRPKCVSGNERPSQHLKTFLLLACSIAVISSVSILVAFFAALR